jgi:signal peptidase I
MPVSGQSTTRSVAGLVAQAAGQPSSSPPEEPSRGASSLAATQTIAAPASTALVRVRWIVAAALVALAALALVRLWMIVGLARTVRIDGPSMAPAWLGGHFRVTCEDCGHVFACDAQSEGGAAGQLAVCPNCGFKDNRLLAEETVPGERVVIDRWPLLFRGPERSEVVAAADPDRPGGFVVKRVAGLPGERLSINGGDLFANGRLVRKSLRELEPVRVLVHDNRRQPKRTAGLPPRWKSARPGSGWHAALADFRYDPPAANSGQEFDWLQYQPWLMFAAHSRTKLSPVLDTDSYNQTDPRQQNVVPDVLLSCRLRGAGRFALAAIDGRQRFEAVFDPASGSVVLTRDQRVIAQKDLAARFAGRGVRVEFGLVDQQVVLSLAGREVFRHEYDRPEGPPPEALHPLAIGAGSVALDVSDLCVWRDIYYLAPSGLPGDWQAEAPLPPDSYALLGDNTTVSTDSRHWSAGVPVGQIIGRVYQPFWLADEALAR